MAVNMDYVLGNHTKRIEGKLYQSSNAYSTKKEAHENAEKIRSRKEHKVRIIKEKSWYVVYVRMI